MDQNADRSIMDSAMGTAACSPVLGRKAAAPHHSSPQIYGEEEEGGRILTGGNHERIGSCGSLTTMDSGGGAGSLLRWRLGCSWNEMRQKTEVGRGDGAVGSLL
jgi:hypothetical protein